MLAMELIPVIRERLAALNAGAAQRSPAGTKALWRAQSYAANLDQLPGATESSAYIEEDDYRYVRQG